MPREGYTCVTIKKPLYDRVKKKVLNSGSKSISDYVELAITEQLKK